MSDPRPDTPVHISFLHTLWGKTLAVLAAFAMILGIGAEVFSIYRSWQDSKIAANNIVKSEADACSARVKAIIDSMSLNEVEAASERIKLACDPNYAAHVKECDTKFQVLLTEIQQMNGNDPAAGEAIKAKIVAHKSVCTITEAQQQAAAAVSAKLAEQKKKADNDVEYLAALKLSIQAAGAAKEHRYADAYNLRKQYAEAIEAYETKTKGKPAALTEDALISLSYAALFAQEYQGALDASGRALIFTPGDLVSLTNRAHALMLLRRTDEAKTIYLSNRGKKMMDHDWNYYIKQDFKELREAGITDPLMDEVEKELDGATSAATSSIAH